MVKPTSDCIVNSEDVSQISSGGRGWGGGRVGEVNSRIARLKCAVTAESKFNVGGTHPTSETSGARLLVVSQRLWATGGGKRPWRGKKNGSPSALSRILNPNLGLETQ